MTLRAKVVVPPTLPVLRMGARFYANMYFNGEGITPGGLYFSEDAANLGAMTSMGERVVVPIDLAFEVE